MVRKVATWSTVRLHMTADALDALALEARWHTPATAIVLPLALVGMVTAAVIFFALFELALAAAQWQRRNTGRLLAPVPIAIRRER